jgi:hypothetical protein
MSRLKEISIGNKELTEGTSDIMSGGLHTCGDMPGLNDQPSLVDHAQRIADR